MKDQNRNLRELFSKYLSGKATHEERQQLQHWFFQLDVFKKNIFKDAREEDRIKSLMQSRIRSRIHPPSPTRMLSTQWIRVAAAVFIVLSASGLLYLKSTDRADTDSIAYHANSLTLKNILLPDGTSVSLNKYSSLEYQEDYNTSERRVILTGEGFFDVKEDKQKPFIVQTGAIETVVLGTAFNIESYSDEENIRVSLLRGKVRVDQSDSKENISSLVPGNMMEFNKQNGSHRVMPIAIQHPESWMTGDINFNNISLNDAIQRIERQYAITIAVDSMLIADKSVTAKFSNTKWQSVLSNILFIHNLDYTIDDNVIHIRQVKP